MSGGPLEIFVPCRTFKVKTQVGPVEALSPMSELVIRAVHEGVVEFDRLAQLFSLGERVMLDLVFDLWRDGHVVIDTFRGLIALTAPTARLAAAQELHLAHASGLREDLRELMQERLTGMVLSTRHRSSLGDSGPDWRVPVTEFDVGVGQVRDEELLVAMRDDLRRTDGQRLPEGDKILSARLTRSSLQEVGSTSWLPLLVSVERAAGSGQLEVEVLPAGPIPLSARREMGRRLAALSDRRPDSAFVRRLVSAATRRQAGIAVPEQAARELLVAAEACASIAPEERATHQEELNELADVVAADIADRRGANAERSVVTTDEHDALLRDMLRTAERQVVIVSPWVRERRVESLYADLDAALARGVQVFLVWGIKRVAGDVPDDGSGDTTLQDPVVRLLMSLRRAHPANFHFSKRSAATHAKLAIQDDRRALVTSYNLLSRPPDAPDMEVGVLLTAFPRPHRCRVIERLLRWTRDEYPEYVASRQIYLHAEDFFRDHDALRRSDARELEWVRPALPEVEEAAPDVQAGAVRVWQAGWVGLVRQFEAAHAQGEGRAMGLVTDSEHRLALEDAISAPCRRLVIASHRIGNEVIDKGFLDLLDERLSEGTKVALLFTEPVGVGRDAVAPLRELAERHAPGQLRIVSAESHAKILVVDDRVTISSFNFLAFQGFYESLDDRGLRRQRTELGLTLVDHDAADAVVAALNERFPELDIPLDLPEPAPSAMVRSADDLSAIGELAEAVAVVASGGDATEAAAVVARSDRPAALLQEADRLEAPHALQRAMIARALQGSALTETQRAHWTTRLVHDRIAARDLVGAALLRAPHPELPGLPERRILLLAAGMDAPRVPETIREAATLPDDHPDWQSLGVLGADRLAVHGDPEAEALVVATLDELPPAWSSAVEQLFGFWDASHRALPLQQLSSAEASREAAAALEDAWSRLDAALTSAEHRVVAGAFKLAPWAREIHELVHSRDEPIGRLRVACDARSVSAVGDWAAAERRLDLDHLVDDAARRCGYQQRLHRGTRTTYLKDLQQALRVAKEIARHHDVEGAHDDPALMEQAAEVVASLTAAGAAMRDEVALAEPAVAVVLELVLPRWLAFGSEA